MKKNIFLFIFLIFINCGDSSSEISKKQIRNSKGEIYLVLVDDCFESKKFDLTNGEVSQINNLLLKAVKKMEVDFAFVEPNGKFVIDLNNYKRQYCAYFNENGEKEVYVNCMCEVDNLWTKKMNFVVGGGKCYFSGAVNLTTNKYYDFILNAPL